MQAMIIDDSRVTRMILGQILKSLGFDVAEACNGAEGLRGLQERPHLRLALIDFNMPEMDGPAVVRAVRADPTLRDLRMLMVTAENDDRHISQCLEAGADGVMCKPFTREQVQERLRHLGALPS